jgi:hypothetical protein
LGAEAAGDFKPQKVADFEATKKTLKICTKKIFGSDEPASIN